MGDLLTFGDGSDGDLVVSADVTDNPIQSSCSGAAGGSTLTVGAGLGFVAGQIVRIRQMSGTGAGARELKRVQSYSGTTLTIEGALTNTYTDSGNSQAMCYVMKQYRSITVNAIVSVYAFDGDVGGYLGWLCTGNITWGAGGKIDGKGRGFRGGQAVTQQTAGYQGEGTDGVSDQTASANGNGGGGGGGSDPFSRSAGGGGGHAAAGSNAVGGGDPGQGGGAVGEADIDTSFMGGGGGSGGAGNNSDGAVGGNGSAEVEMFAQGVIDMSAATALAVDLDGAVGGTALLGQDGNGGGGGAAGTGRFVAASIIGGTDKVSALGGVAGSGHGSDGQAGGNGADGRIRREACIISGTTDPAASDVEGGHAWCDAGGDIY